MGGCKGIGACGKRGSSLPDNPIWNKNILPIPARKLCYRRERFTSVPQHRNNCQRLLETSSRSSSFTLLQPKRRISQVLCFDFPKKTARSPTGGAHGGAKQRQDGSLGKLVCMVGAKQLFGARCSTKTSSFPKSPA